MDFSGLLGLLKEPIRTPLIVFVLLVILLVLIEKADKGDNSPFLALAKVLIGWILFTIAIPLLLLLFENIFSAFK